MKKLTSKNIYIRNRNAHKQSGFSLIEIMIAALILSIGILGVASLQIIGMKGTHQSYMKQQAMGIVQSLTERMHSNKQAVIAGDYVVLDSAAFDCGILPVCSDSSSNCSVADIATVDLHNLICGYKKGSAPSTGGVKTVTAGDVSSLIDGELIVTCPTVCATGDVQIDVRWSERGLSTETTVKDSLVVTSRIIR